MQDGFAASVHFTKEDYLRLRNTYRKWWAGELDRPIVPIVTAGHGADNERVGGPEICFATAWDTSISPAQFVETHDRKLAQLRWHGDAFPCFAITPYGPGAMAAFLGCTPIGKKDTVWFMPPREDIPIEELHFEFDENNPHFRRVLNTYDAAMNKWRGSVVLNMVDLGGILDVLSSFRGAQNLLLDLYDSPDEVLRCVNELQELWFKYFDIFNSMIGDEVMGYSHWYNIFSEQPGYMLQSDFSYMISPDMFKTFVAPELKGSASRIKYSIYHLDGIGELPHLEQLLAMDDIRGIQWVPGSGAPESMDWTDVLSRVLASGKKLVSLAQAPDGTPSPLAANPGQLFFNERAYHISDIKSAQEYAGMYGISVKE